MAADDALNGDHLSLEARSTPLTEDSASEDMFAIVDLDTSVDGELVMTGDTSRSFAEVQTLAEGTLFPSPHQQL